MKIKCLFCPYSLVSKGIKKLSFKIACCYEGFYEGFAFPKFVKKCPKPKRKEKI